MSLPIEMLLSGLSARGRNWNSNPSLAAFWDLWEDQWRFLGKGFYLPLCNAQPFSSWHSGEL